MQQNIETLRHSCAHLLAAAMHIIFPEAQFGTGPSTENWFYYDMLLPRTLIPEDLLIIEKKMNELARKKLKFEQYNLPIDEAFKFLKEANQHLKIEIAHDLKEGWEKEISFYKCWHFVDMCAGPHVEDTGKTWTFKLTNISWAYFRWDETKPMLQRVYWFAFETRDELNSHLKMLEEAKKRDHRVIWEKLKLFTISSLVWAGLPLIQPNWMIIRSEIENYLWELHKNKWYQRVWTPHLAKEDLYKVSGHAEKFWEELFRVKWWDDNFFLKPMNCPHHMQIFDDNCFSYRDMPVRYFEPATVYRDEKTWQLGGLTRVRAITQDDGHLFCRINQITEEVWTIVAIIKEFYTTMWMIDWYWVRLSIRWPEWKYLWGDEVWEQAELALKEAAEKYELPYKIWVWEAAFYWPKLDFMFKDAIWREWQLATIQCDFNLPERFNLAFTNEQWEKERPVVIHRAICGSLERFMWVMIEHFAWIFPLWIAPRQIMLITVNEKFNKYAEKIHSKLREKWIRAEFDSSENSLGKKIRNAEKHYINYILVIWEKEEQSQTLAVRNHKTKEQSEMTVNDFIHSIENEIKEKNI